MHGCLGVDKCTVNALRTIARQGCKSFNFSLNILVHFSFQVKGFSSQKIWNLCFLYLVPISGYCDLNKGECNSNKSKDDSFVERVAKNNS